jgi:hypothetical protein
MRRHIEDDSVSLVRKVVPLRAEDAAFGPRHNIGAKEDFKALERLIARI